MAAQHHSSRHSASRKGWQAIIAHRVFTLGVCVWFGAAFALGALAVRGTMLEQLVMQSGLDTVLAAARPPLGTTARLLLALGFGLAGVALGWVAALALRRGILGKRESGKTTAQTKSATNQPESTRPAPSGERIRRRARDAHPDAPARRPIFAHEELGDEGFDSPIDLPAAPAAPLAKQVAQRPLSPAAMEAEAMAAPLSAAAEADECVEDLNEDLSIEPHAAAPVQAAAVRSDDVQGVEAQAGEAQAGEAQDVAEPAPSARTGFPTASGPTAAERIAGAPLDALSHIELVERLAIAMQRRRETLAATQADEASRQEASAPEAAPATVPATDARAEADAAPARAAGNSVRTAFGIDAAALRRRIEEMPAFQVGNSPANNNGAAMALSRVANGHGSLAGTEASLRAALASLQEIR